MMDPTEIRKKKRKRAGEERDLFTVTLEVENSSFVLHMVKDDELSWETKLFS